MTPASAIPRPDVRAPSRTFAADPCMDGYAVVDTTTGHTMTEPRPEHVARRIARDLNQAAAYGPKAIMRALGAVDDDEPDVRL